MAERARVRHRETAVLAGVALVVFAGRCFWVHRGGAQMPVWDQWIAVFGHVYEPLMRGALTPHAIAVPHNEHHVLMPRLVSMLLFLMSGYWDVKGELVASAAFRGAEMALLVLLLSPLVARDQRAGLVVVVLAAGALPLSPFNLQSGFQVQFALAETFSVVALAIAVRPLDVQRLSALILSLLLAFFSMATAILAMAAAAATILLQGLAGRYLPRARATVLGLLCCLAVLAFVLTPRYAEYGPQSAGESLRILVRCLAFPLPANLAWAAASHLPVVVLGFRLLRGHAPGDRAWLVVAVALWTLMQVAALAGGRGATHAPAEQHLELLALPLIWNYVALARLVDTGAGTEPPSRLVRVTPSLWALAACLFLLVHAWVQAVPKLRAMEVARPVVEARFRESLLAHDLRREYGQMLVAESQIRSGNAAFLYDPVGRYTIPRFALPRLASRERPLARMLPPALSGIARPALFARLLDGAAAAWPAALAAGLVLLVLGLREPSGSPPKLDVAPTHIPLAVEGTPEAVQNRPRGSSNHD